MSGTCTLYLKTYANIIHRWVGSLCTLFQKIHKIYILVELINYITHNTTNETISIWLTLKGIRSTHLHLSLVQWGETKKSCLKKTKNCFSFCCSNLIALQLYKCPIFYHVGFTDAVAAVVVDSLRLAADFLSFCLQKKKIKNVRNVHLT